MIKLYLRHTDNFLPTGYQTIVTFCLTLSIVSGKKLQRNLMKRLCHGSIRSIVYLHSGYDLYRKRHLMNELLKLALTAHGGLKRWQEIKNIRAKASITGATWYIKNRPDVLRNVEIDVE